MGNFYSNSNSNITYDTLTVKPLNWPKKDNDWDELIKLIIPVLTSFEESETPQETLIDLNKQLYNVCQNNLPKKKSDCNISQYHNKRNEIINSFNSKKYSPRPTCSSKNQADTYKELNYGKKKVNIPSNICVINPNWKNFDYSKLKYKDFKELLDRKRIRTSSFDGLCYDLVRRIPLLKMKLVSLFNKFFESGELPDIWYHGIAYGVYKSGNDLNNPQNFRPIVRMDTFSKLYWHFIIQRLNEHIRKYNIINFNIQKAYQKDTNGVIQSLFIHQIVKPKSGVVVYLDIKNAFGSLQSSFVKLVLETYGIPNKLVIMIVSYLENRVVWVKKEKRSWNSGVPQGCVLSNNLFILCMNYILTYIQDKYASNYSVTVYNCKYLIQAFADDIVIYGQSVECIQLILDDLFNILRSACLDLQVKKCVVDYNNNDSSKKVYLNGTEIIDIKNKPNFKYLGQYASVTNIWELFSNDLKNSLEKIKVEYTNKLINPIDKDYWHAYHIIWKYRISWFMNVFDTTVEKAKLISDIEKEWFSSISGLENRIKDEDYQKRQQNSVIFRYKILNNSLDSRVSISYRNSMGDKYQEVSKLYQDNPNLSSPMAFQKSLYYTQQEI